MGELLAGAGSVKSWADRVRRMRPGMQAEKEKKENLKIQTEGQAGENAQAGRQMGRPISEGTSSGYWPSFRDCALPQQEQLQKYAEAFLGLSRLFLEMPSQRERLGDQDLEEVFEEVKIQVCRGCRRADFCWDADYFQSCRLLYEFYMDLQQEGEISDSLSKEAKSRCIRWERLRQAFEEAYGCARKNLMWNNRMMEQRMAVGEQIYQTSQLLEQMAAAFQGDKEREGRIWKKLKRELKYLDISLLDLRIFVCEESRTEVYLTLAARKRACVSARTIAEALSDCCREKMRPAWNCRAAVEDRPAQFHFVPETKYQMFCGIARITKDGEMVSGDNYAFLQKDTGKVVMSLADGMGSGVDACRESEKVIDLLEQFLEAGFPQETAVRMINSCMFLQNRQQIFSTIDLCMVDLYSARCDMIKSGAAATFLLRQDEIEVIRSDAFPAGILQQSDYESRHRQLASGHSIIMMTDGVLEALPEEGREACMAELIRKTRTANAREYARRLMERVYIMQKLQARDDMTILIGNLWEKQ